MVLTTASVFAVGCDATRVDSRSCFHRDCGAGLVCSPDHKCVPPVDGGSWNTGPDAALPAGDSAPASWTVDGAAPDLVSSIDSGEDVPLAVGSVDGAVEGGVDASVDLAMIGAVDTSPVDGPETCAGDSDCPGMDAPYCVQGRCVSCKTDKECPSGAPICSDGHACVSCAAVDAGCPAATPVCEVDSGRCLECLGDGDCARDVAKSFCVAGACAGCALAGAAACAARDPARPVCLPSARCGECAATEDCTVATKPICDTLANTCVPCTSDDQCLAKSGGPGVCLFNLDGHCATDAETVYVGTNATGTCTPSSTSGGSAQMPYCSAQTGVGAANTSGKPVVVLMGQIQGGFVGVTLSAPLTIVGKNAILMPLDYADGIGITSGELYLRNLTVAGNPSGVTGIGISAQAATGDTVVLHMDRCAIMDNPGGGILLAGAAFDIHDCTVTGNGPGQTAGGAIWGGIRVESLPTSGKTSLDFVTIENNLAPGLSCVAAIQGQGVLARLNTSGDITTSCGFVPCLASDSTCGAQP